MILIINICKEELHYFEFVKPIEDILKNLEEPFMTKHYSKLTKNDPDIVSSHRIIITGTSLKDMSYSKDLSKFKLLLKYDKPVFAICGGMQILCSIYGCNLMKGLEIGLKPVTFSAEFLGIAGSRKVYTLHNFAIKDDNVLKKHFHIYAKTDCSGIVIIQAVKHKYLKHFGVLFHPEVRNKDLIINFLHV
jgi:anthranilate/para-aminobenzoate synthase component II